MKAMKVAGPALAATRGQRCPDRGRPACDGPDMLVHPCPRRGPEVQWRCTCCVNCETACGAGASTPAVPHAASPQSQPPAPPGPGLGPVVPVTDPAPVPASPGPTAGDVRCDGDGRAGPSVAEVANSGRGVGNGGREVANSQPEADPERCPGCGYRVEKCDRSSRYGRCPR